MKEGLCSNAKTRIGWTLLKYASKRACSLGRGGNCVANNLHKGGEYIIIKVLSVKRRTKSKQVGSLPPEDYWVDLKRRPEGHEGREVYSPWRHRVYCH
jgi:hypothetical protein